MIQNKPQFIVFVTDSGWIKDVDEEGHFLFTRKPEQAHVFDPKLRATWEAEAGCRVDNLEQGNRAADSKKS